VSVQGVRVLAAAGRKFHRTKSNEIEWTKNLKRHIGHTCYVTVHTSERRDGSITAYISHCYNITIIRHIDRGTRNVKKTRAAVENNDGDDNNNNNIAIIICYFFSVAFGTVEERRYYAACASSACTEQRVRTVNPGRTQRQVPHKTNATRVVHRFQRRGEPTTMFYGINNTTAVGTGRIGRACRPYYHYYGGGYYIIIIIRGV